MASINPDPLNLITAALCKMVGKVIRMPASNILFLFVFATFFINLGCTVKPSVAIAEKSVNAQRLEWFGAKGDGSDDTAAFLAANAVIQWKSRFCSI